MTKTVPMAAFLRESAHMLKADTMRLHGKITSEPRAELTVSCSALLR